MLKINQGETTKVVVTLTEKQTLSSPFWLFVFVNEQENVPKSVIVSDESLFKDRYNEFSLTDSFTSNLINGDYEYYVYEQTSSSNLDPALADNLCERGKARVFGVVEQDKYYTPQNDQNKIYE
jgi:hypothetical protein